MVARTLLALAAATVAAAGCLQSIPGVGGIIVADRFTVPAHGSLVATPDGFKVPEASQLGWSLSSNGNTVEMCLLKPGDRDAYLAGDAVACDLHPRIDFNGSLADVYAAKPGTYAIGLRCLADTDCPVELYVGYAVNKFVDQQAQRIQKMAITLPYAKQLTLPNGVRTAQVFTLTGSGLDYSLNRDGGNTQWILFNAAQVDDFLAGKSPDPAYAFSDATHGAAFGTLGLNPGQYAVGLYCKEQAPCTFSERLE